ncbi:glycosyltransferase family 2 protein [Spirosoma koreense]
MTFSLLVGLKNNLIYTRHFYEQTRLLYPRLEIVFVSHHSTDETHSWLDSLRDDQVRYYYDDQERTLSDTYNKCTELATSDYVIFAHNDMVLAPGFIESLAAVQSEERVISYTTIEPPVFSDDERVGKIIRDFGTDVTTFQRKALFDFAATEQQKNSRENRSFVPNEKGVLFLCVSRKILLDIGGMDALFDPMFCEDDDLRLRLQLKGLEMVVSLNAICYHFVSKTSRFSEEYIHRTRQIEAQSNRNFIRKWGFPISSPVKKKYDIGLVLTHADMAVLRAVEPWFSVIYTDLDPQLYVREEQPRTAIALNQKLKPLNDPKANGVLVSADARTIQLDYVAHIHEAIYERLTKPKNLLSRLLTMGPPTFTWHGYHIRIQDATSYENQLITLF